MSEAHRDPAFQERLIQAVVRPLENAELQVAAERELRESMKHAEGFSPAGSTDEFIRRLSAPPTRRGVWICVAMAMVSIVMAGYGLWGVFRDREWIELTGEIMPFPNREVTEERVVKGLSESDRRLFLGDTSQSDLTQRWEGAWRSQPDRIDLFQQYASIHLKEKETLPPGFREIVDRLDPGNGYFSMMEAGAGGRTIVDPHQGPPLRAPGPVPPQSWVVKDRGKLEKALVHLERAAVAPRFHSHSKELLQASLALLSRPTDSTDRFVRNFYFGIQSSGMSDFLLLAYIVGAKAELCAKEGDVEGFHRLVSTWESLESRFYQQLEPFSAMNFILGQTLSTQVRENMVATAGILRLTAEMERIHETSLKLKQLRKERRESILRVQQGGVIEEHGSYLLSSMAILESYRPESEPDVEETEMRAGRLADYALADRLGALAAWMLLIPAVLFSVLYRFRSGALCRVLSSRLKALLTRGDHLVIIVSCIAPLLALIVLSQTPLGGRQWNPAVHGLTIPTGQLLATVLLMILLPVIAARRRLRVRGAALGWKGARAWSDWLAVICSIGAFIVLGMASFLEGADGGRHFFGETVGFKLNPSDAIPPFEAWLMTATGLLLLAVISIAARPVIAIFSSRAKALPRAVLSRALVPAYLTGMLALAISIPIHHAIEKHWITRDHLMEITPESVPLSVYESKIAIAGKKEFLKIFNADE